MKDFLKTIFSAMKTWVRGNIKDSTADWNQNDPSATNYVKNRPFYEKEGIVYKLDEKYLPDEYATLEQFEQAVEGIQVAVEQAQDTAETAKSTAETAKSDVASKMDKTNPTGTGSFSMNRKAGTTIGLQSHAEGHNTTASGKYSHAEGYETTASGDYSHAEGHNTTASGIDSHTEGSLTKATKLYSHAEGYSSEANGFQSHAEGYYTIASGESSHTEGDHVRASGKNSHAEGSNTEAIGESSHAEGYGTDANGYVSHAEGYATKASGVYSHAEGYYTEASGYESHAEGDHTIASGAGSHAEGYFTTAASTYQHVQGKYNILDTAGQGKYAHIVGNGAYKNRSNAHTLDWDGNAWYQGEVYVGGTSQDDENAERLAKMSDIPSTEGLATESYVDSAVASLVNAAPDTLNTLNELAAALGDDANFATTVTNQMSSKLDASELPAAVNDALAQAKASGEFDGANGTNGTSATHSWSGTTLTITSASGTSSADLKGEKGDAGTKGDKGDKGDTGANGKDGHSPVRGTDYWTDADKAEIKSYVDEAILGGAW